jgi:hypothetical protein
MSALPLSLTHTRQPLSTFSHLLTHTEHTEEEEKKGEEESRDPNI